MKSDFLDVQPLEKQFRRDLLQHDTVLEGLEPAPERIDPWVDDWRQFVATLQPSDEIWLVTSPMETWRTMGGRQWLEIIRDGQVVGGVVTKVS